MIGSAYYLPCTLCLLTQLPLRLYDTLFILRLKWCSIYCCLPRYDYRSYTYVLLYIFTLVFGKNWENIPCENGKNAANKKEMLPTHSTFHLYSYEHNIGQVELVNIFEILCLGKTSYNSIYIFKIVELLFHNKGYYILFLDL